MDISSGLNPGSKISLQFRTPETHSATLVSIRRVTTSNRVSASSQYTCSYWSLSGSALRSNRNLNINISDLKNTQKETLPRSPSRFRRYDHSRLRSCIAEVRARNTSGRYWRSSGVSHCDTNPSTRMSSCQILWKIPSRLQISAAVAIRPGHALGPSSKFRHPATRFLAIRFSTARQF